MVTGDSLVVVMFGHFLLLCWMAAPPANQDFDKDGVVDIKDDCPTDPGNPANKGCPGDAAPPRPPRTAEPEIQVKGNRLSIDEKVRFRSGQASVDPVSFDLLKRIAQTIRSLANKERVQVEGHTDSVGKKSFNRHLSQKRAEAVVAHLVRHGVARARLTPKGFGPARPIADNRTPEGRAKNRRVEFVLLKSPR